MNTKSMNKQLENMTGTQLKNILEKLEIEYPGRNKSEMVRLILHPLKSHKTEVKENREICQELALNTGRNIFINP